MKTKTITVAKNKGHFQGELYIGPIEKLPKTDLHEVERQNGVLIVGHSETGHHHVVGDPGAHLFETQDPLVCYLVAEDAYADLVHGRDFDTHPTLRFEGGGVPGTGRKVVRQREMSPSGWVRAAD